MRSILVTVLGLCACGDSLHPARDAGPADARPDEDAAQPDAPPPDAFVDTTLILRYDFEDSSTTVTDSSGKGKNGTLSDVAAWTADGRNGRGIALVNGSPATQYVSVPGGTLTGVTDFTITTWVKFGQFADFARIYDLGNGPIPGATRWMFLTVLGGEGIHSALFGGMPGPDHENIALSGTATGTNTLPTGVWKHITVTGTGGTQKLYVDGSLAATTTGAVVPPTEMEPLEGFSWLGRSRFDNATFHDPGLTGSLDDFRIYNRVLTDTEIADLAWPQHDYSYWRFDETSGMTAKDSSDNAVASALANGPTWVAGKRGNALDFAGA
ncbi:MAG TPA: LamG domain-containing protein, partial [Kofleriaceae bacterium]|nr:LamG domain-containing protein [Kofleriaceae bacterium]